MQAGPKVAAAYHGVPSRPRSDLGSVADSNGIASPKSMALRGDLSWSLTSMKLPAVDCKVRH